jgi:type IV secretory pathway VirB4 component
MRDGEGARFLFRLSKAGRKRNTGITVVTQDAADLLGTDLGLAVVSNAATQILLRQAPQAINAVGDAFALSEEGEEGAAATSGERRMLLTAQRGQGLLISGTNRTAFEAISSQTEHEFATTDPEFDDSEASNMENEGRSRDERIGLGPS